VLAHDRLTAIIMLCFHCLRQAAMLEEESTSYLNEVLSTKKKLEEERVRAKEAYQRQISDMNRTIKSDIEEVGCFERSPPALWGVRCSMVDVA
jgi:ABC-type siderophore export system fused ATPase/permease subunit